MNLIEIIADWDEPESKDGPGRYYSPRLLLYLISELSLDSRFAAAKRPGDYHEWRMWASRTFQAQLLAGLFNWQQIHAIGALNWGDKPPEFQPMLDPSNEAKEPEKPEEMSLSEISQRIAAQWRG